LGLIGFMVWKGIQPEEISIPGAPSRVALERSASVGDSRFRVLVALANPANVPQLIELASQIATDRNGEIVALRVAVVTNARSDVMLVKQTDRKPLRRFLLPTAGGEHARCAEGYLASILRVAGGSVAACSVVRPDAPERDVDEANKRLAEASLRIKKGNGLQADCKLVHRKSVSVGVLEEAEDYDAVVVGAAGGSIYPQILFGSIPETIAKRCPRTVILVKRHAPVKALMGRVVSE
jgi:nucleotide-binding universal stress UspA family protein